MYRLCIYILTFFLLRWQTVNSCSTENQHQQKRCGTYFIKVALTTELKDSVCISDQVLLTHANTTPDIHLVNARMQ